MPDMRWLWRRVCSPSCTTVCKTYCPGCRAMASEWEAEEKSAGMSANIRRSPKLARLTELARCGVECASAEIRKRLGRTGTRTEESVGEGCGCDGCSNACTAEAVHPSDIELREAKEV